jgi:hypothetical protein
MGKALADADIQPDVYRRAASMLIAKCRTSGAARMLDKAESSSPNTGNFRKPANPSKRRPRWARPGTLDLLLSGPLPNEAGTSGAVPIDRAAALSGDNPDRWIQALAQGRFEEPPYLGRLMAGSLF